jgi:hypothetical protein
VRSRVELRKNICSRLTSDPCPEDVRTPLVAALEVRVGRHVAGSLGLVGVHFVDAGANLERVLRVDLGVNVMISDSGLSPAKE